MQKNQTIFFPQILNTNQPDKDSKDYWLKKIEDQIKATVSNPNPDDTVGLDDYLSVANQARKDDVVKRDEAKISDESIKDKDLKDEANFIAVESLVRKSNRVIIKISTMFPMDFFANSIIVEESRVIFIFRQLFSSQSHTVDIKDISNVFIESSLFSSSLQIVSRTYIQNDIRINNLSRKKANKVRRIIEGLRTFTNNNIDTSNYQVDELIDKLEELHNFQ